MRRMSTQRLNSWVIWIDRCNFVQISSLTFGIVFLVPVLLQGVFFFELRAGPNKKQFSINHTLYVKFYSIFAIK